MIADVSHWHPVIDWTKAKQNSAFLIAKATQGTKYVDPTLKAFIKGCEANEIHYWVFVYLAKGNELAQAKYMVSVCSSVVGKYFMGYCLDIEEGNAAANVKSALAYIQTKSEKTMVYTGYKDYAMYKDLIANRGSNCAWWESRYGVNNGLIDANHKCHNGVDLFQYTSKGTCPGISGKCDLSTIIGSKPESWYTSSGTKTAIGNPYKEPASKVSFGDKGDSVKWVQWCLWRFGLLTNSKGVLSEANIDGVFGEQTKSQVIIAQKRLGLVQDGIVGPLTRATFKKLM